MKIRRALVAMVLAAPVAVVSPGGSLRSQDVEAVLRILDAKLPEVVETRTNPPALIPAKDPVFFLRDRSRVAGKALFDALPVRTRYGLLNIPRQELLRVRFVRRVDPAVGEKVTRLIEQLADEDFDTREQAMDGLREIGLDALPQVREAADSTNDEVKNRAEILVEELEEEASKGRKGADESAPRLEGRDDEVVTRRMTIRGLVDLERIGIGSRYGDLQIPLADLAVITFRRAGPSVKNVRVAPRFQPPGNWFDSKLTLERHQRLRIEATGVVNVSRYGISAGPTGTTRYSGSTFKNFRMLSLVGKIGKKGEAFLVGSGYRGKAKKGGRLYLAIVPFRYDPGGANGRYDVKVRLLEDR